MPERPTREIDETDEAFRARILTSVRTSATPEELARYQFRAYEYEELSLLLRRADLLDPQVLSVAHTFAQECDALAAQWATETRGGL
jgi:hypothetical protein